MQSAKNRLNFIFHYFRKTVKICLRIYFLPNRFNLVTFFLSCLFEVATVVNRHRFLKKFSKFWFSKFWKFFGPKTIYPMGASFVPNLVEIYFALLKKIGNKENGHTDRHRQTSLTDLSVRTYIVSSRRVDRSRLVVATVPSRALIRVEMRPHYVDRHRLTVKAVDLRIGPVSVVPVPSGCTCRDRDER